ncbi:hypothetical protein MFRU_009g03480 [Monilinia fructicola]|nr:hypothetical protein MFRU_009g03480 [Monilinia fructicola]
MPHVSSSHTFFFPSGNEKKASSMTRRVVQTPASTSRKGNFQKASSTSAERSCPPRTPLLYGLPTLAHRAQKEMRVRLGTRGPWLPAQHAEPLVLQQPPPASKSSCTHRNKTSFMSAAIVQLSSMLQHVMPRRTSQPPGDTIRCTGKYDMICGWG